MSTHHKIRHSSLASVAARHNNSVCFEVFLCAGIHFVNLFSHTERKIVSFMLFSDAICADTGNPKTRSSVESIAHSSLRKGNNHAISNLKRPQDAKLALGILNNVKYDRVFLGEEFCADLFVGIHSFVLISCWRE